MKITYHIHSTNRDNFNNYIEVLKEYNLKQYDFSDYLGDPYKIYTIELSLASELFTLQKQLESRLVIKDWYYDDNFNEIKEQCIEIYDDYRE